MHIAQSVINRIHNAMHELEPPPIASVQPTPPIVDEPLMQGAALDASLEKPLESSTADDVQQQGMLDASIAGESPLDGALASGGF